MQNKASIKKGDYDFECLIIESFDAELYAKSVKRLSIFTLICLLSAAFCLCFAIIYSFFWFIPAVVFAGCTAISLLSYVDILKYTEILKTKKIWTLKQLAEITHKNDSKTKAIFARVLNSGFNIAGECLLDKKSEPISETETAREDYPIPAQINTYLKRIKALNNEIDSAKMTEKINELEKITKSIYKALSDNPQKVEVTRKIISYYLPTTVKLVEQYKQLSQNELETETIRDIKLKIENSVSVTTKAFYQVYDNIFRDGVLEFESEIEALKNTYVIDGLID